MLSGRRCPAPGGRETLSKMVGTEGPFFPSLLPRRGISGKGTGFGVRQTPGPEACLPFHVLQP